MRSIIEKYSLTPGVGVVVFDPVPCRQEPWAMPCSPAERRVKCHQTRYSDPKPSTVHQTGASPHKSLGRLK
jgi:hypothetical protein